MRIIFILFAGVLFSVSSRSYAQSTPDPNPDQFVDVSQEPRETIPIEKLIVYPDSARRNGLEGTVRLQALISKDGSVEKVEVLKSDYPIFEDAAIDAMKRAKFTPALQNGVPLKLWITRSINFRLNPSGQHLDTNPNVDSSNFRQHRSRSSLNFGTIIGASLDSARVFFQMLGKVEQKPEADGIHLHSESSPQNQRVFSSYDGIVGDSGVREITVLYRFQNDSDFDSRAAMWSAKPLLRGKLLSQITLTELPNAIVTLEADSRKRTLHVQLRAK